MGAAIAAHFAGAGCKTHLLDLVPPGADASQRSSIAQGALKLLGKSNPPALMQKSVLQRIHPGNLEDDLAAAVGESSLILEAVVERLSVKVELFQKVARHASASAILATNTSGIPIDAIAQSLPTNVQERFLGLHFFNPPRWMHLLEVIAGSKTLPSVVEEASAFCDVALGKGIVPCKDTPNFIGNRVGIAEMLLTFSAAKEQGLSVEEIDFLNGPLLGRPRTGSCRLADMVGLDILQHVVANLQNGLSADSSSSNFDPLYSMMKTPESVAQLIKDGRLGDKTGSGFYKKSRNQEGKRQILSLDLDTLQYRARIEPAFADLTLLLKSRPLEERVQSALAAEGKAGKFLRDVYLPLFNYVVGLIGDVSETPQEIDDAMRWGYGWQLGPFQLLDAADPSWVIRELHKREVAPAPALLALVKDEANTSRFYQCTNGVPSVWNPKTGKRSIRQPKGALFLRQLPLESVIAKNESARLMDLGDGIACLEFRSKANILDEGVVRLIGEAPQLLHAKGYRGMVLGNQAEHFCRGANLKHIGALIERGKLEQVELAVKQLQDVFMNLRHGPIPVVAAPLGQTFGGGTEACLHCAEIQAGADLFMGLVEVGVGVLPAGGGLKEIARRASAWAAEVQGQDPYPWVKRGFEAVATAKVSTSAFEARETGWLSARDGITFHRSRIISDAKKRAVALAERGWIPPDRNEEIALIGASGGANLMMGVQLFEWGGYASAHDKLIGQKIVHVLSGGMGATQSTSHAQHLLDLEREAFVSLCGEKKTLARIQHMLQTKKPLRN